MHLFIAWGGDLVSNTLNLASMADDSNEIRRFSQRLEQGAEIWKAWANRTGGEIILVNGAEGRAQILAEYLDELNGIRDQYSECIDHKVSVGVGVKLSCAVKALKAARKAGGDRIHIYTPDTETALEQEETEKGRSDGETPLSGLSKAGEMSSPALLSGSGNAGMSGATRAVPPSKPRAEASEHSQGEAMRAVAENAPSGPEMTHAASDLEDQLHQHAEETESRDKEAADSEKAQNSQTDAIKKQVFEVLEQVKKQGPVLEQIKQQAPEVYKTIMGMVKAVIAMARELKPQKDERAKQAAMQKSESAIGEPLAKSIRHIPPGAPLALQSLGVNAKRALMAPSLAWMNGKDWAHYDYTHALPSAARTKGYKMVLSMHPGDDDGVHLLATILHDKESHPVGSVSGMMTFDEAHNKPVLKIKLSDINVHHRGQGLGQSCYEALMAHSLHKAKVRTLVGGPHSTSASKVHQALAAKHGFKYKPTPNPEADQSGPGAEFDDKFASYSYNFGKAITREDINRLPAETQVLWDAMQEKGVTVTEHDAYNPAAILYSRNPTAKKVFRPGLGVGGPGAGVGPRLTRCAHCGSDMSGSTQSNSLCDGCWNKWLDSMSLPWTDNWYGSHNWPPDSKADEISDLTLENAKSEQMKVEPSPEDGVPPKNPLKKYDTKELQLGVIVEMEHTDDKDEAARIAKEHLDETPDYYSKLKAAGLAKGRLPMVKPPPTHHNLELPVGSQIDSSSGGRRSPNGTVKVDEGGGEKWREVRAGVKMSSKGQPISALETAKRD